MKGKSLTVQATATMNGKIAATSADSVTRFIQKKLGMDFKSFFTSIFAKQKELNTLSSMNASERRPLILRMLGIDSLDNVIREIKSDKKNKDTIIEKLDLDLIDENGCSGVRHIALPASRNRCGQEQPEQHDYRKDAFDFETHFTFLLKLSGGDRIALPPDFRLAERAAMRPLG